MILSLREDRDRRVRELRHGPGPGAVGQEEEKRRWKDVDDAGFYRYVEVFYGLTGRDKLDNALMIVSAQNRINDVKRYLQGLKWDGTKRLDTCCPNTWEPRIRPIRGL